jgi:hypothetical protein
MHRGRCASACGEGSQDQTHHATSLHIRHVRSRYVGLPQAVQRLTRIVPHLRWMRSRQRNTLTKVEFTTTGVSPFLSTMSFYWLILEVPTISIDRARWWWENGKKRDQCLRLPRPRIPSSPTSNLSLVQRISIYPLVFEWNRTSRIWFYWSVNEEKESLKTPNIRQEVEYGFHVVSLCHHLTHF